MSNPRPIKKVRGWTLSETLVMMIVAGIVFLAVMDGIVLFNRFAENKTRRITANMRLYQGYYNLQHLAVSADSVSVTDGSIHLFREDIPLADLTETDSMLIARIVAVTDTLMTGISSLVLKELDGKSGTDSLKLTVKEPDGNRLIIAFSIKPRTDRLIIKELNEQENQYAYE